MKCTKIDSIKNCNVQLVTFLLYSSLLRCIGDSGPIYEQKLNGNYYLDAADSYDEMAISVLYGEEGVGVIRATIFAVGQNNSFIIAQQHPRNLEGVIDKNITNYFIIPLTIPISKSPDSNFIGPLNYNQFKQKAKEFHIENIEFNIMFKELK